jgi:hypothetical protein
VESFAVAHRSRLDGYRARPGYTRLNLGRSAGQGGVHGAMSKQRWGPETSSIAHLRSRYEKLDCANLAGLPVSIGSRNWRIAISAVLTARIRPSWALKLVDLLGASRCVRFRTCRTTHPDQFLLLQRSLDLRSTSRWAYDLRPTVGPPATPRPADSRVHGGNRARTEWC